MKKTKATLVRQLIFCFIAVKMCLFNLWVVPADAAHEHGAEVSLALRGNYDDNTQFTGDEDYFITITPSVALSAVSEITEFQVAAGIDIREYEKNDDLSSIDQYYQVLGGVALEERAEIDIVGTYVRDHTFQSELEETGIVIEQTSRSQAAITPIGTFWLAPRDRIQLTYGYGDTNFNADDRRDYTFHDATVGWLHDLKNEKTTLGFLIGANRTEFGDDINNPDEEITDETVRAGLQLNHLFSETFIVDTKAGARYSKSESRGPDGDDTDKSIGFVGDVNIRWIFEKASFRARINQNVVPSSAGGTANRTLANLGIGYQFTERLRGSLSGKYRRSDILGGGESVNTYKGRTSLTYQFTRNLGLSLGYSYTKTDQDEEDDTRNRVYLGLTWLIHRPEWKVRTPEPLVEWPHRL